ncbi:MAG: rhodanese-like domain-containing protein [Clostridia bacterium]|nr:rhodanese-like domain-containing protein [Clostridia bacterium]
MKRSIYIMVMLIVLGLLAGCGGQDMTNTSKNTYTQITQAEAKNIMDTQKGYIILDVREDYEFADGHIPGAVLLPNGDITTKAESVLTDKSQLILVYCRSGRRSKEAAQKLADLGYTNVKEFGGIIDWPYGTTKD